MTTSLISSPPSKLIEAILVAGSLGVSGGSTGGTSGTSSDWPIFIPNLPDTPDNCIQIRGTTPILQGRYMSDGGVVRRPACQIMVRAHTSSWGWQKIDNIAVYLDESVSRTTVTVDSVDYLIQSWSRSSGPLPLGKETFGRRQESTTGTSKRYLFTLNGTFSVDAP